MDIGVGTYFRLGGPAAEAVKQLIVVPARSVENFSFSKAENVLVASGCISLFNSSEALVLIPQAPGPVCGNVMNAGSHRFILLSRRR